MEPVGCVGLECSTGTNFRIVALNDDLGLDENGTYPDEPGHLVIWGILNLLSRFSYSELGECQVSI